MESPSLSQTHAIVESIVESDAFEPPVDTEYPAPITVEHKEAGGTIHTIMRVDGVPFASYLPGTKHPAKAHEVAMLILAARFAIATDEDLLRSEFGVIPVGVDYGREEDDFPFGFAPTPEPDSADQ